MNKRSKLDKTISDPNVSYNYVFVNGFESIDVMNTAVDWWANTKVIIEIAPEILYRYLR